MPTAFPYGRIPPGWEPDPDNRGGCRRKKDDSNDGDNGRGVLIIQM